MARKKTLRTIVTIERNEFGMIVKTDRGLNLNIKGDYPDITMTAIISKTISETIKYEDWYDRNYIVELKIEHRDDE